MERLAEERGSVYEGVSKSAARARRIYRSCRLSGSCPRRWPPPQEAPSPQVARNQNRSRRPGHGAGSFSAQFRPQLRGQVQALAIPEGATFCNPRFSGPGLPGLAWARRSAYLKGHILAEMRVVPLDRCMQSDLRQLRHFHWVRHVSGNPQDAR